MKRSDISDIQVIEACIKFHTEEYQNNMSFINCHFIVDILMEETGAPLKVCYAAMERTSDHCHFIVDILMEETGAPLKVCYAAMERTSDRGLIDYGVSLRTAWPTEKGLELLNSKLSH